VITYPIRLLFTQSPFLRILLPFIIGISLFHVWPASRMLVSFSVFLLLGVSILGFNYLPLVFRHRYTYARGLLLSLWLISAGFLLCVLHYAPGWSHWYGHKLSKQDALEVRITSELEEKNKTYKAEAEILQLFRGDSVYKVSGELLLYFAKEDSIPLLTYGDHIVITNKLQMLKGSGNPGAFDYAAYCHTKNWFHSCYLRSDDWQAMGTHTTDLGSLFSSWNTYTRNILKRYIPDTNVIGIAEALLIGYRKNVDQDTWQAYSNTGIVHIIAISGLHMAMVYASARWLLLLIPVLKRRKPIAIGLAIIFMWLFAALTGLPPSVARAAVMFTFIGIGELSNRKIPIYNNLAASAFALLCINPNWLFDVGFQLSYLALISLVLFYEPVYHSIYLKSKPLDWLWKLMAGTLAAQILTFPLCIYYFHQFPVLFLLTNLVAVPASTVILYLEIVLVLFSWIEPLAKVIGIVVAFLIQCLNDFVYYLGQFWFTVWSGLQISFLEMILLFLLVIMVSLFLTYRKSKWLLSSLTVTFALSILFCLSRWQTLHQQKMILYNVPNQTHLQFISGRSYFSPDESNLIQLPNWTMYTHRPALNHFHCDKQDSNIVFSPSNDTSIFYTEFNHKKILRTSTLRFTLSDTLEVDYLILSKGIKVYDLSMDEKLKVQTIILDSSIPFYYTQKLKDELQKHSKAKIYSVAEEGAYIVDL
jgi:competence protein ComEC